jgi:hypothetical protein
MLADASVAARLSMAAHIGRTGATGTSNSHR